MLGSSSTGSSPASLYSIDRATGVATLIGSSGLLDSQGGPNKVSAIAEDPITGQWYGIFGSNCTGARLITIDPSTGAGTIIGPLVGAGFDATNDTGSQAACYGGSEALIFANDGTLYAGGWNAGFTCGNFLKLDKSTGAVLSVLPTDNNPVQGCNSSIAGLARAPDGTLWVSRGNNIPGVVHTINPLTGSFTSTLTLSSATARLSDIAFSSDGTLYGSDPATGMLVTVNTVTGVVTNVGAFGGGAKISGLSPPQVPIANDDPTPGDPDLEVANGAILNIDVLANDTNLGDGVASIATTTPVSGGSAVVVGTPPNLTVDYTSANGYGGTDTFTYTVTDVHGDTSNSATVTVIVDGTTSKTEDGAMDQPVFGGAAFPESEAALSASITLAVTGGTSETTCCTVRDWRVYKKHGKVKQLPYDLDLGAAMLIPYLADPECAAISPGPHKLIVGKEFGVHTDPSIYYPEPSDHRFGVCVVETEIESLGPVFIDAVAQNVVGYAVDYSPEKVSEQALTLGLATAPAGFRAPLMRAITSDYDPRGIDRWSTWYFVPNAQHETKIVDEEDYLKKMFERMLSLMADMYSESAVDTDFLIDVGTQVVLAGKKSIGPSYYRDPAMAVRLLDEATRLALLIATVEPGSPSPPTSNPYGSSPSYANPQGDLVSYAAALRYAVCSEQVFPSSPSMPGNVVFNCEMESDIVGALPALPAAPPPIP
jgi:hypothetical protein